MVTVDVVSYGGWQRALRLANAQVEVIATLDVGPRILRYAHLGGPNLLKEAPEQLGGSGEAEWRMRGGHRMWTAPEDPAHTYEPDNGETAFGLESDGAWITTPASPRTGLEKTMRLRLEANGSGLTIDHVLRNLGPQARSVAPWALTVFSPGGTAIIPLPPYAPHPDDVNAPADDFAPQMGLALWPYFRFSDKRYIWGDRYLRIQQDPQAKLPTKIGASLPTGWVGYHLGETLFLKTVPLEDGATYPDRGCNFETFTDNAILELETLAPLAAMAPGVSASHRERWSLHGGVALPKNEVSAETEDELDRILLPHARTL